MFNGVCPSEMNPKSLFVAGPFKFFPKSLNIGYHHGDYFVVVCC